MSEPPKLAVIQQLPQPEDDVVRVLSVLLDAIEAGARSIVVIYQDADRYYQTLWGGQEWVEAIGMAELARDAIVRQMRRETYAGPLPEDETP